MTGNQKHIIAKAKSHVENYFADHYSQAEFPYHDIEHTKAVVRSAQFMCDRENIDDQTSVAIALAAWFHDLGYVHDPANHELVGCDLLEDFLKAENISEFDMSQLKELVLATNLETSPNNLAEKILKDADLHYLGTHSYLEEAEHLRTEWKRLKNIQFSEKEWCDVNLDFLRFHQFYTATAQAHYQPIKDENFKIIQDKINQYPLD